ncbi:invasion associated locus B family protein [Roseibium sp. SCP14]|uniref:invasion associated locus B family protein n=1 Tax=Roseibium sp. SCP14 TaxID=3141375 RepID=UPI003338AD72
MMCKIAIHLLWATLALGLAGVAETEAATRIQKEFGKWLVACVEPDDARNRCTLSQTFHGVNQSNKNRVFVFSWAVSTNDEGVENASLRTPLGVGLDDKLTVAFPDTDPVVVEFDVCNRRGCFGEYPFDSAWSRALKRNETVHVSYIFRNGREVSLDVDLLGFSDAYAFYKQQLSQ